MSKHAFVLKLESNPGVQPQVRMWIDEQETSDLSSEREVQLVSDGLSAWSAVFDAHGPFTYRIGIVAAPGSRWTLQFRTTGEDAEELLYDADELTMTKEWLIGSCEVMASATLRLSPAWRREAS